MHQHGEHTERHHTAKGIEGSAVALFEGSEVVKPVSQLLENGRNEVLAAFLKHRFGEVVPSCHIDCFALGHKRSGDSRDLVLGVTQNIAEKVVSR